jgi:transcriptional regulator with PAS, ATPase and Fis domain
MHRLEEESRQLAREVRPEPLPGLVCVSEAMQRVCRLVERAAASDISVLLVGESGTGKEVLSRALHALSPRAEGPMVTINCAAIPENLLESELFGHERGAFTGADRRVQGRLELADGGTRISELLVEIPPLRERPDDALVLARHFLERFQREPGRAQRGLSAEAVQAVAGHDWPGNVRELENRVKRAVVVAEGQRVPRQPAARRQPPDPLQAPARSPTEGVTPGVGSLYTPRRPVGARISS